MHKQRQILTKIRKNCVNSDQMKEQVQWHNPIQWILLKCDLLTTSSSSSLSLSHSKSRLIWNEEKSGTFFFLKNEQLSASFFFIFVFSSHILYKWSLKIICWYLDSNRGYLVSESTTLLTVPQPLQFNCA